MVHRVANDVRERIAEVFDHVHVHVHVLSGVPDSVERVLNAWRVPRARNERTGDLSHPSVVYVIGADGRIAYVVSGSQAVVRAAIEAL